MGNGRANSVLTPHDEAVICAARRKTWLALDDLFDHLKSAIAKLTRSNLHRCLQHHGISRVPEEIRPKKKRHPFSALCQTNGIKHKLTKFYCLFFWFKTSAFRRKKASAVTFLYLVFYKNDELSPLLTPSFPRRRESIYTLA